MTKAMKRYTVRPRAPAGKMGSAIVGWGRAPPHGGGFDGPVDGGGGSDGRRAWLARRDEMPGAADEKRAKAEELARRTMVPARMVEVEGARMAADSKALTASAIGRLDEGLDAPEAAAALRAGMEAAGRAAMDR